MAAVAEVKADKAAEIVKVEVLRRWQGSSVNPTEICGIPRKLAEELASPDLQGGPAVKVLSLEPVKATDGIGHDGVIGSDNTQNQMDALITLVGELVKELQYQRGKK